MGLLASEFSDLENDFSSWILPTDQERVQRRASASLSEAREFYEAMAPRVPDLLKYIDGFALDDLPENARNAWFLLMSFIQVALAVELWQDTVFKRGLDETRNMRLDLHNSHPLL